jgi:formylglycine-generating enzyme required for sulfatase activity
VSREIWEEALKNWEAKLANYERELSIAANPPQIFELRKRIEECDQEIARIKNRLKSDQKKSELPTIPVVSKDRRNFIKWIGFGSTGTILIFILPKLFKRADKQSEPEPSPKQSPSKSSVTQFPQLSSSELSQLFPSLSKFDSVELNEKGYIINRATGQASIYQENLGNDINLTMVKIPTGEFLMGSPGLHREANRYENESPQHKVKVSEFYMGQTLVTQAQYRQIMGNNPSHFTGEQISWLDTQKFCNELSKLTKHKYRLPTEAEWEYACRARTITPFHFGKTITSDVANFEGNNRYKNTPRGKYLKKTTPVGSYKVANNFGLYDMHGNLWEWCLDHWHNNYQGAPHDGSAWINTNINTISFVRVMRGGAWNYGAGVCRSASRSNTYDIITSQNITPHNTLDPSHYDVGFRVVCEMVA